MSRDKGSVVRLYCESIDENELCVVCDFGDGKEVFIPKSQITDDSEVWESGQEGELEIPEWLAMDRGLI